MKLLPKLVLFFVPLTILVAGGVITLSELQVHRILIGEVQQKGASLAKNSAPYLQSTLASRKEADILPHLQQLKEAVGGAYAFAQDNQGTVLAHTNVAEKDKVYRDPMSLQALESDTPQFNEILIEEKPYLDLSFPIFALEGNGFGLAEDFLLSAGGGTRKRIGTLRLGLPLHDTIRVKKKIFFEQVTLLVVAIGCVSLGLIFFFFQNVISPAQRLLAGISQISHGEYGGEIKVTSKDELGNLTDSFNRMSMVLAKTTVSKDYMDAILRYMLDPLFVLDENGNIRSANLATTRLLGYSERELLGQPFEKLFTDEGNPFSGGRLEKFLYGQIIHGLEVPLKTKDEDKIPVLFSSSPLKDNNDHTIGILCVARDITERKKLETQVLQSEKMSAVGQLAAGVAHEINNPLGIILGFAQSVKSQMRPDDPGMIGMDFIEKEALRCKELVQNLLMFSRSSKTEQREVIDIRAAVEDALALVTTQSRVKEIELIRELAPDLPTLMANRNQIQQIIINLCNNAMDAMKEKGAITIRTEKVVRDKMDWVIITVRDTGSGIPPELRAKIFEPFFTTKEVGKGTGLGLSLIHEIVRKHHGTIEVQSEVGKGTAFIISLPVLKEEAKEAA